MTDWFRNPTWDSEIERAFREKLRRARRKAQYLRIQACHLASTHPEVALRLLEEYFTLSDDFDHAQAYVDRATAYLALGRAGDAVAAYEAALAREAVFPSLQTQAYLALPFLIATQRIRDHFDRALTLLRNHKDRLTFPVDFFRWHAAQALIAADSGQHGVARQHAIEALAAAGREESGFRYHPSVGLVSGQYDGVVRTLKEYGAA